MKQFLTELKNRNVTRVAITYLAAAWLLVEVADTTFPRFGLEDSAVRNVIILLGIGLIPTLVISWFFEMTPDGLKRDIDVDKNVERPRLANKTADRLIVLMLLAAVSLLTVDKFILDPARDSAELEAAAEAARTEAILGAYADKSIAVLAFDDMSPTRDQGYLSDGIAEELLNMLATIRELRVISRSSAFSFKGSKATTPEIAEKLNVNYILEGSVRKSGDRIRITAQLIDARTDAHMWSQNYDRTLDDVFAIQDEISDNIVEKLKLTLLGDSPSSQKIDPVAYEKYLKAQFIVHASSGEQLREAQTLLNEVLDDAPDYIPALNALGRLYYRIPKTEGMSREQTEAEIRAVADRVVAIEPDGISSQIWQGFLAYSDGDNQAAARFYEKAISLDPNNTSLLRVLVSFLTEIDRPEEAVALGRYLMLRDPACISCNFNLGSALRELGRPLEAIETMEATLAWQSPSGGFYWSLGVHWLVAGDAQKALDAFEKETINGNRELGTIMALHDLGRIEEFNERLARFQDESDGGSESIARIYAWIGDNDKAFEWLDRMVEEDARLVRLIDTDLYDKIKSDPRWKQLRSAHGFNDDAREVIDFHYSLPEGAGSI